jgi:hypothetical protein
MIGICQFPGGGLPPYLFLQPVVLLAYVSQRWPSGQRVVHDGGAACQVVQGVPLTAKLAGVASLEVYVPVKPTVTDADGAMVES